LHRLPVFQAELERAEDNKNDVDKSYRIPDQQKWLRKSGAHRANQSQRQDSNNDVASTCRSCEPARQLAKLTKDQKIRSGK
jgi:hypothetical protein